MGRDPERPYTVNWGPSPRQIEINIAEGKLRAARGALSLHEQGIRVADPVQLGRLIKRLKQRLKYLKKKKVKRNVQEK